MDAVRYYDHGWRLGLIAKRGRKYVHLLDVGTLRNVKLKTSEERHFKPVTIRPRHLARSLDRKRRQLKRLHILMAETTAKLAIQELRQ